VEWASNIDKVPLDVDKSSIFIGHLNQFEVTEEALRQKFSVYGSIVSMNLINRRDKEVGSDRPAFAFVQYEKEGSAKDAVANEVPRVIDVKESFELIFVKECNTVVRQGHPGVIQRNI
jgi:RNA recognition motif-containing protein